MHQKQALPPRILIVGSAGQLGRELQRSFAGGAEIIAADRDSFNLADAGQTRALIERVQPDVILNAAAYTAVDRAEIERGLAYTINAYAPRILAEEAQRRNALLVHFSTDYVFDGSKSSPWTENDTPRPLNTYGASKLAGDRAVEGIGGRYLILRTSWVYGPHGNNFLRTMLRLAAQCDRLTIVEDQIGAPTSSIQLARATHAIVTAILDGRCGAPSDWAGLYNATCSGSTSWFGFAQAIFARAGKQLGVQAPELVPIPTSQYPTPAVRPRNSLLSNEMLRRRFGVELPAWETALDEVIQAFAAAR